MEYYDKYGTLYNMSDHSEKNLIIFGTLFVGTVLTLLILFIFRMTTLIMQSSDKIKTTGDITIPTVCYGISIIAGVIMYINENKTEKERKLRNAENRKKYTADKYNQLLKDGKI